MSSRNVYLCVFSKHSKDLFKFMKLFKIVAKLKLHVMIHERSCEGDINECRFCDCDVISINGNHFHIFRHASHETKVMTLLLPYQYDFHDVDRDMQYDILKYDILRYNDLTFDTSECSNVIDIFNDSEVIRFTIAYEGQYNQFEDLLAKNDIHDVGIADESSDSDIDEETNSDE